MHVYEHAPVQDPTDFDVPLQVAVHVLVQAALHENPQLPEHEPVHVFEQPLEQFNEHEYPQFSLQEP